MKKSWKILIAVIACAVVAAMIVTVSLSVMTYLKVNALEQNTPAAEEPETGVEGEDDVLIGGEYMIRSTQAISDAYLSGDSSDLSDRDKETLGMASEVLSGIITDGMSAYEKEQAVFLWMHENIGGDPDVTVLVRDDVLTDNPHGVLSGHSAVCVGYATTFRLFMQMLDIPCHVVHDVSQVHSWDLVRIDGHWYHVDLYSAQMTGDPLQYLNRSDALQRALGSEWDASLYPAADSLERCYLYQHAVKSSDVYAIPAMIRQAIDGHEPFVAVTLPAGEDTLSRAENLLSAVEAALMGSEEYQSILLMHAVVPDGDGWFAYIMVENYSEMEEDDDDGGITPEEQEQIDRAISESFGELTDLAYYDDDYGYWG